MRCRIRQGYQIAGITEHRKIIQFPQEQSSRLALFLPHVTWRAHGREKRCGMINGTFITDQVKNSEVEPIPREITLPTSAFPVRSFLLQDFLPETETKRTWLVYWFTITFTVYALEKRAGQSNEQMNIQQRSNDQVYLSDTCFDGRIRRLQYTDFENF